MWKCPVVGAGDVQSPAEHRKGLRHAESDVVKGKGVMSTVPCMQCLREDEPLIT
jgi:hypothetical protein